MEPVAHCPAPIEAALQTLQASLTTTGVEAEDLERGLAAARLVGALTDSAALALAVLAFESQPGDALSWAEVRPLLDAESQAFAEELQRLGEFGGGMPWSLAGRLQEPQAETLRRMLLSIVGDPRLVVARIAVQLARLRAARTAAPATRERLAAETRAVFAPLANRLGIWQLKWELEDLAFRYLEPEDYRRIAAELSERRTDRDRYIEQMRALLERELQAAGLQAEVSGRAKHLYSIHRKMQRKQLEFDQLSDIRALRIVCASVPDCYAALGIVHGRWRFVPGEFDDYIATPKDNGYRSIHTAVIGPEDRIVEIQIRTREMHERSELGVAAHWRYKEGGTRDAAWERRIEWVRHLLDPAEAPAPGGIAEHEDRDFIDRVRSELFEDRLYVLTPRGEVVDLPRDATPLDFAYHLHSSLGHRCRGARVNGRIVPLTYRLGNGEVVEILTGKQEAPSRDWLSADQDYLASARSRAKVRAWFRREDAGANEVAGRTMVERELARLGAGPALMSTLVGELKAHDASELYRWLGEGELSLAQFTQAAIRRLAASAKAAGLLAPAGAGLAANPGVTPRKLQAGSRRPSKQRAAGRGNSPVEIEGVGHLPVTLARCCAPVRPQPIVGYVTLGRGVTVHAASCAGLQRMQATRPAKILRVRWTSTATSLLPVELTVSAYDRRGLVRDLSEMIAAQEVDIESMQSSTDRKDGVAHATLHLQVRDLEQMTRLIRLLAGVQSVISARRTG